MANPIQFTMVSPVPLYSAGAAVATIDENCGESEITTIPQIHKHIKKGNGGKRNRIGEAKQKRPDKSNEL